MKDEMLASAREGFAAWQAGDFATLEALLDPGVQWRWFEPGDWDCRDRKDVMARLRERFEEGFVRGEVEFLDGGEDSIIIVAHPAAIGGDEWPSETATVVWFRDGKVVRMQDYRTREDALAALR